MRFIRYVVLGVMMIAIVMVAVANKDAVSVKVMPPGLDSIWQWSVSLPLFFVILASVLFGLLLGYVLEWVRERRHRRDAAQRRREVGRLEQEVAELRKSSGQERDEILAILN